MSGKITATVLISLLIFGLSGFTFATEDDFSFSAKKIVEKLAKLEEGQKGLNKRIDDLRGEFKGDIGELGNRIDDLRNLVYVLLGGIIYLIGFVIWDRRSALSPVVRKTKELEDRDDLTVRALKEYARKEPKVL